MKLKLQRNRQILLLVGTIIFSMGLGQLQLTPTQALDKNFQDDSFNSQPQQIIPLQPPTEIASNIWKHASFPVDHQFSSYTINKCISQCLTYIKSIIFEA